MKKLRKISKEYHVRQIMSCWLVFYMLFCFGIPARVAVAVSPTPDPIGFVNGAGTITQPGGLVTNVTVQTQESIIHWNSIDTIGGEDLNYLQDGVVNANVLNRVTSGIGTEFYGNLNAEEGMSIWILNPAGILFGSTATINVTELVASSLNITNEDFLNGAPYQFTDGMNAGVVEFRGSTTALVEIIALIGKEVINKGALVAGGLVIMAAGDTVAISDNDGTVAVEVAMGGGNPSDYIVNNHQDGDGIEVTDNIDGTAQVILAAGDVWSAALVKTYSDGGSDAVATVDIQAAGDVVISEAVTATAEIDDGESGAIAQINIEAGGNVELVEDGQLIAYAETMSGPADASSAVNINAEGDVHINQITNNDDIGIEAGAAVYCQGTGNAEATVGISAENITLDGPYSNIDAWAETGYEAGDAAAVVNLAGDGDVVSVDSGDITVESCTGEGSGNAVAALNISAAGEGEANGDVIIGELGDFLVNASTDNEAGETSAAVDIEAAGNVEVIGGSNGEDGIFVRAKGGQLNTGDIAIDAGGDVSVTSENGNETAIFVEASEGEENNSNLTIDAGGDVSVVAKNGSRAEIEAEAEKGNTNTANVLICADGTVEVTADLVEETVDIPGTDVQTLAMTLDTGGSIAQIQAEAGSGNSNSATVGIGAKEGVEVASMYGGTAEIIALTDDGFENTSRTVVCSQGDIVVSDIGGYDYLLRDGDGPPMGAGIRAIATDGYNTHAYVGVCADGDVAVVAGIDLAYLQSEQEPVIPVGLGGYAEIRAEAETESEMKIDEPLENPPTATAETVVVSKGGGVGVIDVTGIGVGEAGIVAEAHGAYSNTANVGVSAASSFIGEEEIGVVVAAIGPDSKAQILSHAYNGAENTADTVVCTPGEVLVMAYDYGDGGMPLAKIKSWAGMPWEQEATNKATTRVYGSEVDLLVPGLYRGNGIGAWAVGSEYLNAGEDYILTEDGAVSETEGGSELLVDDYSAAEGCPDCPGCPCGSEEELLAPVAHLWTLEIPRVEGCPVLTQAAAMELGIAGETLQVGIGNALALNPNIQPCEACGKLVNAAAVLRDEDGSRMAAMVQMFNALASADAPFTPEMATSVAMAFEGAAEGSQYATAMEYVDAFVQYIAVLDTELGSPVGDGDSVAFVMDKYGEGITSSGNGNIAAYVLTRLETIGM